MVQVSQQSLTFEMFITQYGDDERYELIDGELIDMEPVSSHEQVAGLINCELNFENRMVKLKVEARSYLDRQVMQKFEGDICDVQVDKI